MCKSLLIEDFENVLCAYKEANKGKKISCKYIKMDKIEADTKLSASQENTFYYGIFTVGRDTTVTLQMDNNMLFELASNSQIIEVFQRIYYKVGNNIYFRGWVFTID